VSVRSVQREENPLCVDYDFAHYKQIHWFLFEDLYEWAGQVRAIDISKKTSKFCLADKIENQAELVFARLRSEDFFRGLKHSDFVDEIVDFYCETNYIHPFREGNGRTQRVFIALRVMMPISLTWTANC
jgi:cell filamentation protein